MLDTFVRNKNLEAMLTKAHRENKRFGYSDKHTFACVTTMMDELDDLIVQSSTTRQGKYHLKQWLDSFNDHRFSVGLINPDAKQYQKDLVDHIVALRSELNGVEGYKVRRDPYNDLVYLSEKLKEITWCSDDVRLFWKNRNRRCIDKGGYLAVPAIRGADYIFLFNSDHAGELSFVKRTVVLISGNPEESSEQIANIASIEYVEAVVIVGADDHRSRIYLTNSLNDIYGSLLNGAVQNSEILFDEVSGIDGDLRNCISEVLLRIKSVDDVFEDYSISGSMKTSQYRQQVKILKKVISEASRRLSTVDRVGFIFGKSLACLRELKVCLNVVARACDAKLLSDLEYGKIDESIHSLINAIKKNRMLYGERKKGEIHSEEVIASILKTLLETRFDGVFSVTQEEKNGSGFSDIAIKKGVSDLSLIECKMLRKPSERQKNQRKIAEGMHQVYERYSQRLFCSVPFEPLLYLVLFTVDPDWKEIRKDVEGAIEIYCERNSLEFTLHGVVNKSCIEVRIREKYGVSERDIVIQVVIVALEDTVNKDDYALKPFDPKG
ncbi:hypothetical protein [Vibrio alginolyticus]|uniref:hypothetical protein n=1 Tax=Vibrio alginolyticus TaxID=663 RepID=UPI0006CA8E0A|nr:hypothetical protein [Vibrio alginolyticus]KPM97639.1 hypothetical protein AOG25_14350 [Vibrio alginolyticus]CAH7374558.1 conserved hypothetical protein [Vibrio chagasii]